MTGSETSRREERRLKALERYGILGTDREQQFDDLVRLASRICGTGSAALNFIGEDQQWTKACEGIDLTPIDRDCSFCTHTIQSDGVLVVPDATRDPRFADNPLVKGEPFIRFYAGAPLITPDGERIGALCVIDSKPCDFDEHKAETLQAIAGQVMAQLELRRKVAELSEATSGRERAEEALRLRDRGVLPGAASPAEDVRTSPAASSAVWMAFLLSLSITLIASWISKSSVDRERNEIFAAQVEDFVANFVDRLSAYEELQRAAAAFVSSSEEVTREEWNHFVDSVAIERRYPGLRMTGLVEHIPSGAIRDFLSRARIDSPDFSIRPNQPADEHFIVRFVSPQIANSSVEGFDVASDPARRLAAIVAMDTGLPRATSKIRLIQDPEARPAFLVFHPIYRKGSSLETAEDRRSSLIGWVYLGVRVDELIEQLPAAARHGLAVDLSEEAINAEEAAPVLYSSGWTGYAPLEADRSIEVYGQTWTLAARARPELFKRSRWREPAGVFAGGLLFSSLITGIAWSLANTRRRALRIAGEMTEAYESSARFTRAIVDGIGDGTLTIDREGRITSVNRAAEQIFGCSPSNLVGADIRDVLPTFQPDVEEGAAVAASATRFNGRPIDVEAVLNPLGGEGSQKLVIVRDVTERNRSERETRLLQSLSLWITESRDLDEAIRTVLEELCSLARWPYAEAWLPDPQSRSLVPGPSWHRSEAEQERIEIDRKDVRLEKGSGLPGKVWQTGLPLFVRDLAADRHGFSRRTVLDRGLRAALAVPVLADREVVAVLVFFAPEATEEIESYTKVVTATASQLGGVMQRKRASDALVESHNALEAVLDAATEVSIIATDPEGIIRIFNKGAERMLGYRSEEVVGSSTPEIIHLRSEVETLGDELSRKLGREIRGFDVFVEKARHGVVEEREWTYVRKDGEHLTVTLAVNGLRDAEGRVIGFLGVAKDITLRNRAIHELRSSESRVRSIIDSSLGGVITFDRFGIIESVNPAAESMFGYSETELVGRHFTVLLPEPEEQPPDFRSSRYAVAVGKVTEWQGRRRNGDVFPMEVSLFEFSSTAQINFAGHVMDVSKRHEVDRLKRDFVSTVSHELRTPLTSIRGALGLLASGTLGDLDEDAKEMVSVAERNSVRLIDLINDILDFERLESGRMEMHPRRTTFRAIVDRSLENVRTFADQTGVEIEVASADGDLVVDEDRIVQVLVNLLSNAIKFSPAGSVVTIATGRVGDHVECRVIDRGKGITLEAQTRLFQRFQQVDSSDRRERGGTGLGLAISKAIVHQHEGEIGVESTPEKGSTFWFRLPAFGDSSARKDVLAIEGDETLLKVMKRQLDSDSVLVRTAFTCGEGLDAIERKKPDLIILDVGLPDGDAYILVEQLRKREALRDLPVLVYTGRDLTYDQRNELRLGPTRFLLKSKSTGEDLRELMEELLRATESRPGESTDH
jgi:PAS domain S-box-containing protein